MAKKRVFISFAVEDVRARDLLVGQSKHDDTPFEFVDMSVKEPWDSEWKTRCRTKIRGCDGVIALLSKNTQYASGALWEIKCAVEEGIPITGVHIYKDSKGPIPSDLIGHDVIEWTWDGIGDFIDSL
ncbi:TIR domain-containing protein [Urbifossiella limnaea]|uniref:Thoeris protein ThsB TIR-like domain-containing protein n=1 Tax=Urbifossiella limnaea TaxID=2528023 RepID=A0A517XWI8_9BACT|nr:TIR domain-containing protein [Urbifossiella limnaea]QDU21870.1 hypothetical protein ETAA1_38430 [Urbifossiella limnaea]